jgi:hypothetical protein
MMGTLEERHIPCFPRALCLSQRLASVYFFLFQGRGRDLGVGRGETVFHVGQCKPWRPPGGHIEGCEENRVAQRTLGVTLLHFVFGSDSPNHWASGLSWLCLFTSWFASHFHLHAFHPHPHPHPHHLEVPFPLLSSSVVSTEPSGVDGLHVNRVGSQPRVVL